MSHESPKQVDFFQLVDTELKPPPPKIEKDVETQYNQQPLPEPGLPPIKSKPALSNLTLDEINRRAIEEAQEGKTDRRSEH